MNRSLEALAILVICLVGILAAVRISTKDRSSPARAAAPTPDESPKSVSPKGSSSSAHVPSPTELVYDDSCGLDRTTGKVYRPLMPLLSPRQFAERVIRSEPLPLIVLPEAEAVETVTETATGYDAAYDEAMADEVANGETPDPYAVWLSINARWEVLRRETISQVAHYQRAYAPVFRGLAANWNEHVRPRLSHFPRERRGPVAMTGTINWPEYLAFADRHLSVAEAEVSYSAWMTIHSGWELMRRETTAKIAHYQRAYTPTVRGLATKWNEQVRGRLLQLPHSPPTAKKDLLLNKRAEVTSPGAVTWRDYLAFADKRLPVRQEVKPQSYDNRLTREFVGQASASLADALEYSERLLNGAGKQLKRVARQTEDDEIWQTR